MTSEELELEAGAERQDTSGEDAVEDAHGGLVDQLAGGIPLQARADTVELGGVEHVVCLELNAQTATLAEDRKNFAMVASRLVTRGYRITPEPPCRLPRTGVVMFVPAAGTANAFGL